MCYRLWIVSPLSLTEIRSMLPRGFSADIASTAEHAALRPWLPGAQTVATVRIGGCACALRTAPGGDGERHLRRRYATLGLSRDRIIAALERHRRGEAPAGEPVAWRAALAGFVAEHARNAGPTLYYLRFAVEPGVSGIGSLGEVETISAAGVRAAAEQWLQEDKVIEVQR